MAEKRIVVPEEMLKAAREAHWSQLRKDFYSTEPQSQSSIEAQLEAALRWLDGALETQRVEAVSDLRKGYNAAIESLRSMFFAPEPEVPEAEFGNEREVIDAWLNRHQAGGRRVALVGDTMAQELLDSLEAYRRGKEGR